MLEIIIGMAERIKADFYHHVSRAGAKELWQFMMQSDFFIAPASCKFHLSYAGGLFIHSYLTYMKLMELKDDLNEDWSEESMFLVAIGHDFCKVNNYKVGWKWYKGEDTNQQWIKQKRFEIDDKLPLGHGEKSMFILHNYIKLTSREALAIRYHLGFFDPSAHNSWTNQTREAFDQCSLARGLHLADMHGLVQEKVDKFYEEGVWVSLDPSQRFTLDVRSCLR